MKKPTIGDLVIIGEKESRTFFWRIYLNKRKVDIGGGRAFKSQRTARNDAVRMAKRLNIRVVEKA